MTSLAELIRTMLPPQNLHLTDIHVCLHVLPEFLDKCLQTFAFGLDMDKQVRLSGYHQDIRIVDIFQPSAHDACNTIVVVLLSIEACFL